MRVLVTGAARGLGLAVVREGLRRGHHVAATVRAQGGAEELDRLAADHADRLSVYRMNVTDSGQVSAAATAVEAKWGAVDGIVNNAAIMIARYDDLETLNLSDVRESFEVNVLGTMSVVQRFLPLLYRGTAPVVINVSSEAGTVVNAFAANYAYSISKTAVNMFTERLRDHLAGRDILAWAVHPGWMRTAMGGDDAPVDPAVTAGGFWDILERKTAITSKIAFIDATGRPMPL